MGLALAGFRIRERGKKAALSETQRFGEFEMVMRVTEEAFHFHFPHASGSYPWKAFERLQKFPEMWLLYVGSVSAFVLPTDQLGGGVGEFITTKVIENGGKVK
jgi:hypothetical protein